MQHIPLFWDLLQAVVGLFGGCLFVWWWATVREASTVYIATMFALFGFAGQNGIGIYARHQIAADPYAAVAIANTWWFVFRDALTFASLTAIVVIMSYRTLRSIRWLKVKKLRFELTRNKEEVKNAGQK